MYTGPNIPTNGLVLSLDAANTKSYVSGSTTWRDLAGNSRNGAFVNSPTYDAASLGSIQFNGSNSYVDIPGSLTSTILGWTPSGSIGAASMSIELWFQTTDDQGTLYSKPWNGSGGYNMIITVNSGGSLQIAPVIFNNSLIATQNFGIDIRDGKIHQLVCWMNSTNMGYYIDGGRVSGNKAHNLSIDVSGSATNNNLSGVIGSLYPYGQGWAGNTNFTLAGSIYSFRLYHKVLSAEEVSQIYNSQKSRFGL